MSSKPKRKIQEEKKEFKNILQKEEKKIRQAIEREKELRK